MITLFKHNAFKYLLLIVLSLKISSFVYENLSSLNTSDELALVVDFDENEEKKELDENEKIHQQILGSNFQQVNNNNENPSPNLSKLKGLYLEYTSPPPEFV